MQKRAEGLAEMIGPHSALPVAMLSLRVPLGRHQVGHPFNASCWKNARISCVGHVIKVRYVSRKGRVKYGDAIGSLEWRKKAGDPTDGNRDGRLIQQKATVRLPHPS